MKIACIIPARYASTRLPAKPLLKIAGQTLVERVYKQVQLAKIPVKIIVATDSEEIVTEVRSFGGEVVLTREDHRTGTDRLAEVAKQAPEYDIIINVQGDEPLINPELIDSLAQTMLTRTDLVMATAATELKKDDYNNPNVVKVVRNMLGDALYFSRSLIPWPQKEFVTAPLKHIGIYAYRRDFLLKFAASESTPLEKTESLEQLRVLEMGHQIAVILATHDSIGIDTPEDLKLVESYILRSGNI